MTKFLGKIEELQKLIADLGFEGEWEELPNELHQFTSADGAILNFYQNKTVQFQGPKQVKTVFEAPVKGDFGMEAVSEGSRPNIDCRSSVPNQ